MKEEGESSQNVKPRSKRNSVASASASASATPVNRFRHRSARSPSPPLTAAARYHPRSSFRNGKVLLISIQFFESEPWNEIYLDWVQLFEICFFSNC